MANRILHLSVQKERPYFDKQNLKILQEGFDPLRIKLRIMPVSRAPHCKGMNADYYFIEAGKIATRGDLTIAIDLLKRGLALTPGHFFCRFNLGVLYFKFGLVVEAAQQFQQLTTTHAHEAMAHYNLAVCLSQMGVPVKSQVGSPHRKSPIGPVNLTEISSNRRYELICQLCDKAVETAPKDDLLLIADSYQMQAIAHYRLNAPLAASNSFTLAKKYQTRFYSDLEKKTSSRDLDYEAIYAAMMTAEQERSESVPTITKQKS